MTLTEKVELLERNGLKAVRLATLWRQKIQLSGEQEAEKFYLALGHNHIERKGFEWEGLTLSREPTEAEKRCVKGIAGAQQTAKEQLTSLLTKLRAELISDGLKGISELEPSTYHTLVLDTPAEFRTSLRDRLIQVHREGRELIVAELNKQGKGLCPIHFKQDDDEDEFEELDTLTDVSTGRVANDVQSRLIGAAARFTLLGLLGAALLAAIQSEVNAGSISYIDRSAGELSNKVISLGRYQEMQNRSDEIDRYQYSSLLDQNTCDPCLAEDGKEASSPDDLEETPNPSCLGAGMCRCFIVMIQE